MCIWSFLLKNIENKHVHSKISLKVVGTQWMSHTHFFENSWERERISLLDPGEPGSNMIWSNEYNSNIFGLIISDTLQEV